MSVAPHAHALSRDVIIVKEGRAVSKYVYVDGQLDWERVFQASPAMIAAAKAREADRGKARLGDLGSSGGADPGSPTGPRDRRRARSSGSRGANATNAPGSGHAARDEAAKIRRQDPLGAERERLIAMFLWSRVRAESARRRSSRASSGAPADATSGAASGAPADTATGAAARIAATASPALRESLVFAPSPASRIGLAQPIESRLPGPGRGVPVDWISHQVRGLASYYGGGDPFTGGRTATGEILDDRALTAAHRSLPLESRVRVTDDETGKSVVVRINDRGPYFSRRIIDLSVAAAHAIGLDGSHRGLAPVHLEVLYTPSHP